MHIIRGLKPEIKNYVIARNPVTPEEAEQYARFADSLLDKGCKAIVTNINSDSASTSQDTNEDTKRNFGPKKDGWARRNTFPGANKTVRFNRRTTDGRPICDFCNKVGHYKRSCRVRLKTMKCRQCGEIGHVRRFCKNPPKHNSLN